MRVIPFLVFSILFFFVSQAQADFNFNTYYPMFDNSTSGVLYNSDKNVFYGLEHSYYPNIGSQFVRLDFAAPLPLVSIQKLYGPKINKRLNYYPGATDQIIYFQDEDIAYTIEYNQDTNKYDITQTNFNKLATNPYKTIKLDTNGAPIYGPSFKGPGSGPEKTFYITGLASHPNKVMQVKPLAPGGAELSVAATLPFALGSSQLSFSIPSEKMFFILMGEDINGQLRHENIFCKYNNQPLLCTSLVEEFPGYLPPSYKLRSAYFPDAKKLFFFVPQHNSDWALWEYNLQEQPGHQFKKLGTSSISNLGKALFIAAYGFVLKFLDGDVATLQVSNP